LAIFSICITPSNIIVRITTKKNQENSMVRKKVKSFIVLFCLLAAAMIGTSCQPPEGATIVEETETFRTYPFSEPDPVPILTRSSLWGRGARLYPYFFFDKFSKTAVNKDWKVIHMENPYIQVSVLPELGGKVWGASEKSTGNEFIYTNHVMKFREIALRGPWTSGGIEFNFGIVGHTPSTAAPVDYMMRQNPDGSVSCVVGTMDLPSRTRWSVTIHLPKDKAYFETKAFWYNPSPFHQSYYSWMNAAVKVTEDLQFIFPGNYHIGHDYSVPLKPWPVDEEGRDLSWYRNNNFGSYKSYFTVGEYENFFGGYWHDLRFGFGHWALYDDVPGHKIWIWGLSRQGMIWEDLLTDSDGQYSEPQAGRYFNQSDHSLFFPYTADSWREIWFPYKNIGPMKEASPLGVLNVDRKEAAIEIGLFPLEQIDNDLVVSLDEEEIYREHLSLRPTEIYTKEIPRNIPKDRNLEVYISNRLFYSSDPQANDLTRPIRFHPFDETTAEGLFLSGQRHEQERNLFTALEKYLNCLEKEPLHTRALCRVAELYCRRGENETARFFAHRALLNEMYDPEANYVYGIICRRLGDNLDAKECLGWAARSLEYRSSAYAQMSEIYFLEKDYDLALEYNQRSLDYNRHNINALLLRAAIHRLKKEPIQAQEVLQRVHELEPLNHLVRYEHYLLEPSQKRVDAFQDMIRNELPDETYIEMALHYVRLGLNEQAVQLLEFASDHPTACYWLAYLWNEIESDKSQMYLEKAQSISPWLIFPFREESIPVFEWASQEQPEDWKSKYYLALIFWSKGRVEDARGLFDSVDRPDFAPFYLARGHFYKNVDLSLAQKDFEYAVKLDEKSWKTWHSLVDFCNEQERYEEALESALPASRLFPDEGIIRVDLVRALMGNEQYTEAAEILDSLEVLPYEGASNVHKLFVLCHVNIGLENIMKRDYEKAIQHLERAKTYPENLGTGQPYESDQRMQDYLLAVCYERLRERDRAKEIRKAISEFTQEHQSEDLQNHYFGGLVLVESGQRREGRALMRRAKLPEDLQRKIRSILR
jgi:tetratricopeptide (TPR) repeat protein